MHGNTNIKTDTVNCSRKTKHKRELSVVTAARRIPMAALLWMFMPAVMPAVSPLTVHSDRRPQINGDLRWQEDLHRIIPSRGTSVPCKTLGTRSLSVLKAV